MHPGYKPTLAVSHTGTPISTPLMHHHTAAEFQLLPEDNSTRTAGRLSGVFTGSNLSLHTETQTSGNEVNHTSTTVQMSREGGTSYALRPLNDYPSPTTPSSSSVVVESPPPITNSSADRLPLVNETTYLRRVCSDTTSPRASIKQTSPSNFSSSHETIRPMSFESNGHSSTVTPSASRTVSLSPELHSNNDGADYNSSYV